MPNGLLKVKSSKTFAKSCKELFKKILKASWKLKVAKYYIKIQKGYRLKVVKCWLKAKQSKND